MRHNLPVYATVALALILAGHGMLRAEEAPMLPYMPVGTDDEDRPQGQPVAQNTQLNADAQYQEARLRWLADCRQRFAIGGAREAIVDRAVRRATSRRVGDKRTRVSGAVIDELRGENPSPDYCEDYLARATYNGPGYTHPYPVSSYPSLIAPSAASPAIGMPYASGYSGYGPFMMVPTWVAVPAKQVERVREVVDYVD